IDNGGSLSRLTSANLNMSYSLSSSSFSESESDQRSRDQTVQSGKRDDDLFGRALDFSDQRLNSGKDNDENVQASQLYTYSLPWSLRLAYAVNYSNNARQNEIASHSLMFSGDVEISPRWSIGASSGYDFKNQGFTYTQLRFERDLMS